MGVDVLAMVNDDAYKRYFAAAARSGTNPMTREAWEAWRDAATRNPKVIHASREIAADRATHIVTHELSEGLGEAASSALSNVLTLEAVGKTMERELAMVTVDPVLRANYATVTAAGADVQRRLYRKAGFGLNPQTPEIDIDRLQGLIEKLCDGEYVDTRSYLGEAIVNFTEHVADELVRRNAEYQTEAGFEPYVMRILAPGCCDWCAEAAGRYPWSQQPQGLWRRHKYCRCVMDYNPAKTTSRNVLIGKEQRRGKKWVIT